MRPNLRSFPALFFITVIVIIQSPVLIFADEASTIRRFEHAKASEPQLIALLKAMPKGADLHNHVGGAVYAETFLDAAIKSNLYFDPKAIRFVEEQIPGSVPAKDLLTNSKLASKFLDNSSIRGCYPAVESGHDHFFDTFSHFDLPDSVLSNVEMLQTVVSRAMGQNIQYMELMGSTVPGDARRAALQNPPPVDDMEAALAEMQKRFPALIAASKAYLDQTDAELAKLLDIKDPTTGADGPINFRYIYSVSRISANESFFAQMACGMALVQNDKRIVSVNILAPEDDTMARRNFKSQMKIIDFLWNRMGKPKLTLHAGELTLTCSPLEDMRSRIRMSVELGHAQRIGHGVSIAWEDDLPGLLNKMKRNRVCVEICLTSNDVILNVSGDKHPFNLYREAGVPINLNTDDEGVNRSNLTMEFLRAVRTYNLSYKDLKWLARNSIEYSFLPGISLYRNGDYSTLLPEFKNIRTPNWVPSDQARKLMASSEKLTVQVRLERAFVKFEN